jgi:hypothetical protein
MPFTKKLHLKLSKTLVKVLHCMAVKLGHFGRLITNTWKLWKCVTGEGWRSAAPIM